MPWDKLKTFYYVAEAGSFTRAALRLHISQSAISRSIIDLEDRLGYQLFSRRARGLDLTEEGEIIFQAVQRMMSEIESAKDAVNDLQSEPQGHLKIATTPGFATIIIKHLPKFLKRFPKMQLSVINEEDIAVGFQKADVGFYPKSTTSLTLIQEYVSSIHLKLYASPKYLKKFGIPEKSEDLDHHQLISYGDHSHPYSAMNWFLSLGAPYGKVREPYMQFNASPNLFEIAKAGHGIITLGDDGDFIKNSPLVEVLPDVKGPEIPVYYLYPEHFKTSQRVQAVGSFLKEILHS